MEWVASNKLVMNISKTKSIAFGASSRPQLNLVMNGVAVEQVEETKIVCIVNLHTALTHTLIPPDMPPGVFS